MESRTRRIVITGGGTGGHIFPGITVARELAARPDLEVLFVGKQDGLESKWVPDSGFAFEGIPTVPFPRGLTLGWLTFGPRFLKSLALAGRLLSAHRPDAVLSTGGYVSVPVSLSAFLRGVPLGLFEPNVVPGLAARLLGVLAKRVFVGFEETKAKFNKRRTRWTGIPVRQEIIAAQKAKARESFGLAPDTKTLLMLGGSQGAHVLNRHMTDVVHFLGQGEQAVQVIMMTGWDDYRSTVDSLEKCPLKVVLRPFLSNIHEAYAAADLVVARAGAVTCAEIMSRGLPALFIPYPHASGHQERNARALERAGAAVVIVEKELEEESLTRVLIALLGDDARLKAMGESARGMSKPSAAREIAEEMTFLAVGS